MCVNVYLPANQKVIDLASEQAAETYLKMIKEVIDEYRKTAASIVDFDKYKKFIKNKFTELSFRISKDADCERLCSNFQLLSEFFPLKEQNLGQARKALESII